MTTTVKQVSSEVRAKIQNELQLVVFNTDDEGVPFERCSKSVVLLGDGEDAAKINKAIDDDSLDTEVIDDLLEQFKQLNGRYGAVPIEVRTKLGGMIKIRILEVEHLVAHFFKTRSILYRNPDDQGRRGRPYNR